MRLGVIGTGHIAAPMVRFLAARGHDIAVTGRNATVSAELAETLGVAVGQPQEVIDRSEVVLLCLRPAVAGPVLEPLRFRADQQVISVMAGIGSDRLAALCAPVTRIVRTIPLGFLEQGGCPLAGHGATDLLADLFAPENPVIEVPGEAALNAHFAICAMVPGLLDLIGSGAEWLGRQTGDADAAEFYASQLMAGFLASLPRDTTGHLATARDALATDGTLSLQMTRSLRDRGAHAALQTALAEIENRLNDPDD